MNTRNVAWGIVAVGVIGAGVWWMSRPAPAPAEEKPVVAAAPTPKVAAPVVAPTKMTVAAPVVPAVVASAKPQEVKSTAASGIDPELNVAVDKMITILEAQDYNAFVDDFIAPGMADMMKSMATSQFAQQQNLPPEAQAQFQAQMQQMMDQRMPQMIQQMKDQVMKDPKAAEGFLKMANALKVAKSSPPEMNATGDRATYTLDTAGDKDLPPHITMVQHDGKWTLDLMSMDQTAQEQGQ